MIGLTTTPVDGETEVLGKHASELQENVVISGDKVTGTLKYVSDFAGYSDQPEEQVGNYLAIDFHPTPEDATIEIEMIGSESGPKTMKSKQLVARIADKDLYKLKVTVKGNDLEQTTTYDFSGLTLNPGV